MWISQRKYHYGRLCVVGAGVALTLVPCFKEIKIGEISLVNEIEKQKEEAK